MNTTLKTIVVGLGATALVDIFTFILSLFTHKGQGILLIGRWVAYAIKGTFFHNTILATPAANYELLWGWLAHYTIGILFAFALVGLFGKKGLLKPNLRQTMIIGCITLCFPVFLLQPAMGFGVGFSKLPHAAFLLTKIIAIHMVYGLGLFGTALFLKKVSTTQ